MSKKAEETIVKTPNEVKLCNMDFAEDLLAGEAITAAPSWTSTPAGLTITAPAFSGSKAQGMFAGGTNGVTYLVKCEVQATGGQIYQGCGDLHVEDLG